MNQIDKEKEIQDSEEKFRSIVEASPLGIHIYKLDEDDQLIFIGANPAADRILKVDNNQFIGKTIEEAFPPLVETEIPYRYRRAALEGESYHTTQIRYKDGFIDGAYEVNAFQTSPRMMVTMFLDITEREKNELELKQYRERLEEMVKLRTQQLERTQTELIQSEKLAVLGQLTATVSHEIRNPLGSIRASLFAIGDALERNDHQRINRALDLAERNINRCDNIITELLDYSRSRIAEFSKINIDFWLNNLLSDFDFPDNISLTKDFEAGITAEIDSENLKRVLINILSNSVQSMQENNQGGNIVVRTSSSFENFSIRIDDQGKGIQPEILERIFEPLFSTKTFGVGLGLVIVKNIIDQHGGTIKIDSIPGKGTTISLILPLVQSKD